MQFRMSKKWDSKPALDEDGQELRTKSGKPVLKKSYSVLQDEFFIHMRTAGYTDIERGERGSSEEHLTVTQFKVEREQERLAGLTEQTQQKEAEAAALDKKIEKTRQRKVDIESIDKIEAGPIMLSPSRVSLEQTEYETLAAAAKKYHAQEKQEGKLKKLLNDAKKTIADMKAKIESLVTELSAVKAELAQYKSIRGKLRTAYLEQENDRLRSRLCTYEDVISRNNLWPYFSRRREKTPTRDDVR